MKNKWTGERLETFVLTDATIEHLHRYAIAAELVTGKTVLDIACGEGYGSNLLSKTAKSVNGVDIAATVIEQATKKYNSTNLSFTTGAVENIPFPDQHFDCVVSFETLEHTDQHEQMLAEVKRVLKPGGLLLISTPEKKTYTDKTGYQNPFHKKELYQEEFTALLSRYFTNHTIYSQHQGMASVIAGKASNGLDFYTGDYRHTEQASTPPALYLLALCSDNELPLLPASIFSGEGTIEAAVQLKEKEMRSLLSYRIGHAILLPFKWVRQLFSKRNTR